MIYRDELGDDAVLTFTREPPEGWSGHTGRIDAALLSGAAAAPDAETAFICGSNRFVEAASRLLLEAATARCGSERALRADRLSAPGWRVASD